MHNRDRSIPTLSKIPLAWSGITLLAIAVALRVWYLLHTWPRLGHRLRFYDFDILYNEVIHSSLNQLYRTDRQGFSDPGSPFYKYPPPFAAFLYILPSLRTSRPIVFAISIGILILTVTLLLKATRPGPRRCMLIALLFWNWQPTWETLGGLQLESGLLLLFMIAFLAFRKPRRGILAGVAIGIAGAFKVYPLSIAAWGILRRNYAFLLAGFIGAVSTLAAATVVIPVRTTVRYFTGVLPTLGGVSLSYENVGLPANVARFELFLTGRLPGSDRLAATTLRLGVGSGGIGIWAMAAFLLIALVGLWLLWRSTRAYMGGEWGESFGLMLLVPVALIIMPSSWLNYQALLAVPLFAGIALTRRTGIVSSLVFVGCLVIGSINGNEALSLKHIGTVAILRSLLPVLVLISTVRTMRSLYAEGPLGLEAGPEASRSVGGATSFGPPGRS